MKKRIRLGAGLAILAASAALAGPPAGPRPGDDGFVGPSPARAEPEPRPEPVRPAVKARQEPEARPAPRGEPASEPRQEPRAEGSTREESMPLGKGAGKGDSGPAAGPRGEVGMTRTILALSAVLAVIVLAAGVYRKLASRSGALSAAIGAAGRAPSGILSVLGRYPLDRSTTLVLMKVDRRVLLLAQTRGGVRGACSSLTTLSEITGAEEVASIMAKAAAHEGASPAAKFTRALEEASEEVEEEAPAARRPAAARPAMSTPSVNGAALAAAIEAALKRGRKASAEPAAEAEPASPAGELRRKLAAMRAKAAHGAKNGVVA